MIGHQVILVYRLDSCSERLPDFRLDIALDVAAHNPEDVGTVFISVSKESSISLCLIYAQFASFNQAAPDTNHTYIDIVLGCYIYDIVHVIPVRVGGSVSRRLCLSCDGVP